MLLAEARAGYAVGLCLLPVAADGSKRPDTPSGWREFQARRPTAAEMRAFDFTHRDGYGVVGGMVSGGIDPWDFDDRDTYRAFVAAADSCGLGSVVARIQNGYEDETPRGGRRWLARYGPEVKFADTVLARRPGVDGESKTKTLIEITTFSVLAPSTGRTHPSGQPYVRLTGDFATIAEYTVDERDALFELARSFDEMPRREQVPSRKLKAYEKTGFDLKPGVDFNRRTTWRQLLGPLGWVEVYSVGEVLHWRRRGKRHGVSATTNYRGSDLLYVFSSSTEFDPEKSYSKFGAYALLHHAGDFSKAALALSRLGYGDTGTDTKNGLADHVNSAPARATRRTLHLTPATEISVRPIRWMWQDRIGLGTFALLGGREGVGKTIAAYTIAAMVTRGMLPGAYFGIPRAVIIAATEDSWEHTIVPRLMAAGADLAQIFRVDVVTSQGIDSSLSLPRDLPDLERVVRDVGAALIILDPLLSRLDTQLDTHKDAEVRIALEPLVTLANATDACVLGLIHVNKSASSDVLTLLMGSRAFAAVARSVLFVMVDPENEQGRLLGQPKNNLGRADLPTLAFRIEGALVATTSEGEVWTVKLEWLGETDRSIREVVEAAAEVVGDRTATAEAADWLQDFLKSRDGVCDSALIHQEGRRAGHSKNAINRARQRLHVTSEARGFPRKAYWHLSLFPSRPGLGKSRTTGSIGPTGDGEICTANPSASPVDSSLPVGPVNHALPADGTTVPTKDVNIHAPKLTEPEDSSTTAARDEDGDERRF